MQKNPILFLILFALKFANVQSQESEAAKVIFAKIQKAEIAIKEGKGLNQYELNQIVCLTNIEPKKGAVNYTGVTFYPSESEIQSWKDWYVKNKSKISYSVNSEIYNRELNFKVILVEYETGKFRNNVCDDDKILEDWLKN